MGEPDLAVGLLGPLVVTVGGRPVSLSPRLRAVLAALAMSPDQDVSIDRLAGAVWGDDLPDDAGRALRVCVTRLRKALGPAAIGSAPHGYRLRVDPDQIDATRFTRLLDAAALAADPEAERTRLAEALALWRGGPFDGVNSLWLHRVESARLEERRLAAVERRIELDLAARDAGETLVAELTTLTARHPLRERLWGHLMTALYQAGRQADALEAYRRLYQLLADELGVEPGTSIQELHRRILNADPALDRPAGRGRPTAPVPRQLPAGAASFTGRSESIKHLDALLADDDPSTVVISAIAGTAGIGKTALALHWARRVAHRFGDGQLYVDLRGFDPSGQAMEPTEAVRGFLQALGVAARAIPVDPQAQIGMYRSLLAGRRLLVVLDNARDTEQVRPLLPGTPGCLAVVTSRSQLSALVAGEGARPLTLDVFTVAEARQFLADRLGAARLAAEPRAVDEIVARCAGLPLALAIVAARAVTHPTFPLQAIADDLADRHGRLDALAGAEPAADVRAVFSWSYRALTAGAARLFRLLGLHPGPDVSAPAAASLSGSGVAAVRPLLAELANGHMIMEKSPGRYGFHDLLRAYAGQRARAQESDGERRAAVHRMLDHYLHSSHAAASLLNPHRDHPLTLAPAQTGVTAEVPGDHGQSLDWTARELPVLLAVVPLAASRGFDTHAWQLAWTLTPFLGRRGHWHDWITAQHVALRAVQRLGDPAEEARTHRGLARAYRQVGRFEQAHAELEKALRRYGELGDDVGLGHTHNSLGQLFAQQSRYRQALAHALLAVDLLRGAGDAVGEALALNGAGWCQARLGDREQALEYCQRALELQRKLGDQQGEATTLDSLGYLHHIGGDHGRAVDCYQRSLALRREGGDRHAFAATASRLGDALDSAGDRDGAMDAWRRALDILDRLGHPDAEIVRPKLAASCRTHST